MLAAIDLLGPGIKLKVKNQDNLKTNVGGFFTIILLILSVLSFIAFGRDLFEKKLPEINYNKEITSDPKLDIDDSFLFMFALVDLFCIPLKERDKKFTMYILFQESVPELLKQNKSLTTTFIETKYYFEQCREDRIPKKLLDEGLPLPASEYYCLPKNETFKLRGMFGNGKFTDLKINVDICNNATNNNNCYPDSYIRKNLSVYNMWYVIHDGYITGQDFHNPGKVAYSSGFIKTNPETYSRAIFWYKNVEYMTDIGWILEDYTIQNFTYIEKIHQEVFPTPGSITMLSHIISVVNLKEVYRRKYIKIQGVFAYIGGFIKFFQTILIVLDRYIVQPNYLDLFYEFYLNKERKKMKSLDNPKEPEEKGSSMIYIKTINHRTDLRKETALDKRIVTTDKDTKYLSIQKKPVEIYSKLGLTLAQSFCRLIYLNNPKKQMLNKLERLFGKKISIEKLIKINKKIEVLEFLFYEDYQKILSKRISVHKYNYTNEQKKNALAILKSSTRDDKLNKKLLNSLSNDE